MRALHTLRNSRSDLVTTRSKRSTHLLYCSAQRPIRDSYIVEALKSRHGQVLALCSMATAASILAVVRAAAPQVRSQQDELVFALHAAVLASGYRLVAVGDQADLESLQPDAPDVSLTGWNSSKESYSFAYISEDDAAAASTSAAGPIKLLLKALVMDDTSLVTCLATDASGVEPKTLELNLENYTTPSSSSSGTAAGTAGTWPLAAKTYKNLDQLAQQVNSALGELTAAAVGSSGGSSAQKQQSTAAAAAAQSGEAEAVRSNPGQQGSRPAEPQQQPDPDYDPLRIGPPRRPMRVGHDDIMPPGLGGLGGIGGGMLPGGPGMGGGMHVGPDHPFFADRMRHPDVMPGRGGLRGPPGPGGMRWDPINPEGLEGWRPEDFQRPRGGGRGMPDIDPDIGLPGPGRGTDWDSMYG